jgi:DNA-binding NarL/FixJ family response regulator
MFISRSSTVARAALDLPDPANRGLLPTCADLTLPMAAWNHGQGTGGMRAPRQFWMEAYMNFAASLAIESTRRSAGPFTAVASKVLIVDDHALLRMGIAASLGSDPRLQLELLEAGTLADALALYADQVDIDLVLLDLNLPDCKGLQGLKQFRQRFPKARVAVVSGTHDVFVVDQVRSLGALAYITKGQSSAAMCDIVLGLLPAIGNPAAAGVVVNPSSRFPSSPGASRYDRVAELGPRHLEILELVLSGCSNQEISNATGLSLGTIKNYVSTVLLALDVKSRSHLISLFS